MNKEQVHPSAIIEAGAKIGAGTKVWHFSHVMGNAVIGKECILGQNVFVGENVKLADRVKVQNNVSLFQGVGIAEDVFIGPSVVFTNVLNPRSFISRRAEFKQTFIHRGASIGANTTVVCGIKIGEYALVGAGSVVTKDVLPFALVYGNPARQRGWVSKEGIKLEFTSSQTTIVSGGTTYKLEDDTVTIAD